MDLGALDIVMKYDIEVERQAGGLHIGHDQGDAQMARARSDEAVTLPRGHQVRASLSTSWDS